MKFIKVFILSNSLINSNLNFGLIHIPNSKAISLCAYVSPYLPAFDVIPIALVFSTYSLTLNL